MRNIRFSNIRSVLYSRDRYYHKYNNNFIIFFDLRETSTSCTSIECAISRERYSAVTNTRDFIILYFAFTSSRFRRFSALLVYADVSPIFKYTKPARYFSTLLSFFFFPPDQTLSKRNKSASLSECLDRYTPRTRNNRAGRSLLHIFYPSPDSDLTAPPYPRARTHFSRLQKFPLPNLSPRKLYPFTLLYPFSYPLEL